jgi:hypothetical protein
METAIKGVEIIAPRKRTRKKLDEYTELFI